MALPVKTGISIFSVLQANGVASNRSKSERSVNDEACTATK